jgi:hypothetical protein
MRPGLFAFAAAAAFLGAALYINFVEQPARLRLGAGSMVREWAPSNRRGFVMLFSLAVVSAIAAYVEFRSHWRRALDHRRDGDSRELALCLFRSRTREHLVVRDPCSCSTLCHSRTHARLGSARMGANRNRIRRMLRVRLGLGFARLT